MNPPRAGDGAAPALEAAASAGACSIGSQPIASSLAASSSKRILGEVAPFIPASASLMMSAILVRTCRSKAFA